MLASPHPVPLPDRNGTYWLPPKNIENTCMKQQQIKTTTMYKICSVCPAFFSAIMTAIIIAEHLLGQAIFQLKRPSWQTMYQDDTSRWKGYPRVRTKSRRERETGKDNGNIQTDNFKMPS